MTNKVDSDAGGQTRHWARMTARGAAIAAWALLASCGKPPAPTPAVDPNKPLVPRIVMETVKTTPDTWSSAMVLNHGATLIARGQIQVGIWDIKDGALPTSIPIPIFVTSLAVSPDQQIAAAASPSGMGDLLLLDIPTRKQVADIPHNATVMAALFSPDGKTIASVDIQGMFRLFNAQTRAKLKEQKLGGATYFVPAPDGATFLGCNQLLNFAGATLAKFPPPVSAAAFSPDGNMLAISGTDLKLWDTSGKELKAFASQGGSQTLAFSPDGKLLAAAGAANMEVFDVASGTLLWSQGVKEAQSLSFSADSAALAVADKDGVRLLHAHTGKTAFTLDGGAQGASEAVYVRDPKWLVTFWDDGKVRIWDDPPAK